jgi:hypothetical protein
VTRNSVIAAAFVSLIANVYQHQSDLTFEWMSVLFHWCFRSLTVSTGGQLLRNSISIYIVRIFWVVTPWSHNGYRCFGGTRCLGLQRRNVYVWESSRFPRSVPAYRITCRHNQKTTIWTVTALKISELRILYRMKLNSRINSPYCDFLLKTDIKCNTTCVLWRLVFKVQVEVPRQ